MGFFLLCKFTKGSCENRSVTEVFYLQELCVSLQYSVDANQLHDENLDIIFVGHVWTGFILWWIRMLKSYIRSLIYCSCAFYFYLVNFNVDYNFSYSGCVFVLLFFLNCLEDLCSIPFSPCHWIRYWSISLWYSNLQGIVSSHIHIQIFIVLITPHLVVVNLKQQTTWCVLASFCKSRKRECGVAWVGHVACFLVL